MATSAARLQKATVKLVGNEPSINPLNYKLTLIAVMNWHNVNSDDKTRRKWIQEYVKQNPESKVLTKATDFEVRQVAVICRLIMTDQYVDESTMEHLNKFIENLKSRKEVVAKVIPIKPVVSVQDRIGDAAAIHIAEVDAEIDAFVINKKSDFSMKSYLLSNNISGAVARKIGDAYKGLLAELKELLGNSDVDLSEGYSNFKKVEQKRFYAFVQSIANDCLQQVVSTKTPRAPRKKKPVAAGKIVSKLKYLNSFDELKLTSVNPSNIVDSDEVWLYNTKLRKLIVYRALPNEQLTVKGTTILNFDVNKSSTIHIRKPDEFFKDVVIGKRALNNKIKQMKSAKVANGRVNAFCVIIGVFK